MPIIWEGILRVKPTSEPNVNENAAIPPEKKAQYTKVLIKPPKIIKREF